MRVAVDNNVLIALANETTNEYASPDTRQTVRRVTDRAEELVRQVVAERGELIVPAPAWGEFLQVKTDDRQKIARHPNLHIYPYDQVAAEQAARNEAVLSLGVSGGKDAQVIKVDHQILAICQTFEVDWFYTHDRSLYLKAKSLGINCSGLEVISPLEQSSQQALEF